MRFWCVFYAFQCRGVVFLWFFFFYCTKHAPKMQLIDVKSSIGFKGYAFFFHFLCERAPPPNTKTLYPYIQKKTGTENCTQQCQYIQSKHWYWKLLLAQRRRFTMCFIITCWNKTDTENCTQLQKTKENGIFSIYSFMKSVATRN